MRSILALAAALAAVAVSTPAQQSTGPVWSIYRPPQATLVLSRDGSLLGEIGAQWRTSVPLSALPLFVPQAFIAVEDQRFYTHDGVDLVGVAGAIKDAVSGHPRGASTITQQLVGNLHPDQIDRRDRTISRKLREQDAAREMEKHYSKAQILEAYLNVIQLGHRWYGVDEASRHYFGHPASQLTLVEAATLAALPKGPAIYDPVHHADKAKQRRDLVLALMADQGFISDAQKKSAQAQPLVTDPDQGMPSAAPYVVDMVRDDLERSGVLKAFAPNGLRVTTTIDSRLQRAANDALREGTLAIESRDGWRHATLAKHAAGKTDYLQGAIVAIAPLTGDILALVGGRDHAESPYNRAVAAMRQPGSAFKPVVYATALARGFQANSIVYDTAISISMPQGPPYEPRNSDGKYLGAITLREALVHSRNTVAVQLGVLLGMDSVAATASRLEIGSPIRPFPSSAIGSSPLQPLVLVRAYTAIANGGPVARSRYVDVLTLPSGDSIPFGPAPLDSAALDPRVAFVLRDMMRDVVARGTATSVRALVPDSIPVAGKTGTTNDNSDVWFIGMTPQIVAGVWLGFDSPASIAPGAAGGTLAAPIWGQMIAQYYRGRAVSDSTWIAPPAGVIPVLLDRATGAPSDSTTPPEREYTDYIIITPPVPAAGLLDSLIVATPDTTRRDSTAAPIPPP